MIYKLTKTQVADNWDMIKDVCLTQDQPVKACRASYVNDLLTDLLTEKRYCAVCNSGLLECTGVIIYSFVLDKYKNEKVCAVSNIMMTVDRPDAHNDWLQFKKAMRDSGCFEVIVVASSDDEMMKIGIKEFDMVDIRYSIKL